VRRHGFSWCEDGKCARTGKRKAGLDGGVMSEGRRASFYFATERILTCHQISRSDKPTSKKA
jgi:hypothetical protein